MQQWKTLMEQIDYSFINGVQTPCYILDKYEFERSINGFKEALVQNFNKSIIGYSVKTNSLPYCLSRALEYGCYAEVVSFDEYKLALLCGYPKNQIIYNGPMKSKETFIDAITNGAIVNIETKREINWLDELPQDCNYGIGIRLNVNISNIAPEDAVGNNDFGRFGFSDETNDFLNAVTEIQNKKNIRLVGLHIHRSPHTRSVSFYQKTVSYATHIIKKYNLKLSYLDIGGGYYGIFKDKPTYSDYCNAIKQTLEENNLKHLTIIVEPGMAILGSAFTFVTRVIDTKQIDQNLFVITTDGSRNDVDPLFKKESYIYNIIHVAKGTRKTVKNQVIAGCSCIESDKLFSILDKPLLMLDDIIIYNNVGAYTMCLSPLFIRYFPSIYVIENGKYEIIRNSWSASEYIQNSKI